MTEKPSRNEDEYFVRREADILKQRRAEAMAGEAEAERRTHFMKCPRDGYDLHPRDVHGVSVESCSHCSGVWLDAGELDALAAHEDHHNVIGRVFTDLFDAVRRRREGSS